MKTLVVFYSRSGITRTVAQELATVLGADIEEIVDAKNRSGFLGSLVAGKDAMLKHQTEIGAGVKDPAGYDLVIVGTPVWAFTMVPAVRAYLTKHAAAIKQAAFFATMGGSGDKRAYEEMQALLGKAPLATASFIDKHVKAGTHTQAVAEFVKKIKAFDLLPKR